MKDAYKKSLKVGDCVLILCTKWYNNVGVVTNINNSCAYVRTKTFDTKTKRFKEDVATIKKSCNIVKIPKFDFSQHLNYNNSVLEKYEI